MTKKFICDFKVSGKGIPLFLIHGIGSNKKTWKELIIYLSKFFTVISYALFLVGLIFGYKVILPLSISFFTKLSFSVDYVSLNYTLENY